MVPDMKSGTGDNVRGLERELKALANGRRLAILRILRTRKAAPVGEIAELIKLSFKATSKHLAILYAANIVEKEQVSLTVNYSLVANLSAPTRAVVTTL